MWYINKKNDVNKQNVATINLPHKLHAQRYIK